MEIVKKGLVLKPVAKETKILAQSLYSTYVSNGGNPYIFEPIDKFYKLFGFADNDDSLAKLLDIFVDLTEPILLEYFELNAKQYSSLILTFCDYKLVRHKRNFFMEVDIDERYLEALKRYVANPYLKVD